MMHNNYLQVIFMLILNFSHPLTEAQLASIRQLTGSDDLREVRVPTQLDQQADFLLQIVALADACGLAATEWQTEPLVVNPPALNFVAVALLAELHGRMGYFATCLRLRPVAGSTPPQFEVVGLLNLQAVRDEARTRR